MGSKTEKGVSKESSDGETENGEKGNNGHPFVGKRVKILNGPNKGITTVIASIRSRGWWTVEHPDIDGVVHSGRCKLLDEVKEEEMREYYNKRGMKYRPTSACKPIRKKELAELTRSTSRPPSRSDSVPLDSVSVGGVAFRTMKALEKGQGGLDSEEEESDSPKQILRKRKREPQNHAWRETDGTLVMSDLVDAATNGKDAGLVVDDVSRLRALQRHPSRRVVLPPITLHLPDENNRIPESLQSLPPTLEVDIFDRKTGRILRGRRAVQIQDLASVLRDHPEYEPIVPPVEFVLNGQEDVPTYREGRSAPRVRVSASVVPQDTVHSLQKGMRVKVKGGQYKGSKGTVSRCLPGSWCLVEGLDGADQKTANPVVISLDDLMAVDETRNGNEHGSTTAQKTGRNAILMNGNKEGQGTSDEETETELKQAFRSNLEQIFKSKIQELGRRVVELEREERDYKDKLSRISHSTSVAVTPELVAIERRRLQKCLDDKRSAKLEAERELNEARNASQNSKSLIKS